MTRKDYQLTAALATTASGQGPGADFYVRDDGGRAAAGRRGYVQDCVVRAITIASDWSYDEVWAHLSRQMYSPGKGVRLPVYEPLRKTHLAAVVDGQLRDTWDCTGWVIDTIWTKGRVKTSKLY